MARVRSETLGEEVYLTEFRNNNGSMADATGVVDSTTALQRAIDSLASEGGRIIINGTFKLGDVTYPTNKSYTLVVNGRINLVDGATFTIPQYVNFEGIGGPNVGAPFQMGPAAMLVPSETSNPGLRIIGVAGKRISNLNVHQPKFVGILVEPVDTSEVGALALFDNVNCYARAVSTSLPLKINTFFWAFFQNCAFGGQAGSHPQSILLEQTIENNSYIGLLKFEDTRLNVGNIKLLRTTEIPTGPLTFIGVERENPAEGTALLEIENNGSGSVHNIEMVRCKNYDAVGAQYLIKVTAGSVIGLRHADCSEPMFHPDSLYIDGVEGRHVKQVTTSATTEEYSPTYMPTSLHYHDSVEVRNAASQVGPCFLPYAPLAVDQDPANWTTAGGATVTTGKRAPDGSMMAGQVAGTNGGTAKCFDSSIALAVNDWLVVGGFIRSSETTKRPSYIRLDVAVSSGSNYVLNGSGATHSVDQQFSPAVRAGGHPVRVCKAYKVTTAGSSGTGIIRLYLVRDTSYGATDFSYPGIIHIPASAGLADAEVMWIAKTLGAWPSAGAAGRLALPTYQHLQLSMAWDKGHIIDEAGNHLWMSSGKLYTKTSAPGSGTDGTVVGAQT